MLARTNTSRTPNLPGRGRALAPAHHRHASHLRAGFTLIEILVVVIVISILMALLLPAIMGVKTKANEAKVVVEIKQIEGAIGAFKVKYGVEPPSRFTIWLTKAGWDSDPPAKAFVRRIWPQFDFSMPTNSYPAGQSATTPDWNSTTISKTDTNGNKYVGINCGECLMFFLGGIQDTNKTPMGFSKNPSMPFSPTGTNREGPFMEFDIGRIRDLDNSGMSEYYDPLPNQQNPYLYFSSYEGKGYRTTELPNDGTNFTLIRDVYRVYTASGTPPQPPANVAAATAGTSAALPAQKAQTFQIISPGLDGEYGVGGVFNASIPNAGLADKRDYDNLTNFNGGRLGS